MSFICKECGPTTNGQKQHKFPTKVRDVVYNLQVKTIYADKESVKIIKRAYGKEIVKEASYCQNHIPEKLDPQIVEKVIRNCIVKTVLRMRGNFKEEEE